MLAWVKHDMEKRADSFEELFSFLNLKLLTKLFLAETVAKEVGIMITIKEIFSPYLYVA